MPIRRGIGAGLSAGADALANVFGGVAARNGGQTVQAIAERRREGLALLKDWHDKVLSGDLEPEQAQKAAEDFGVAVPPGFFADVQPSVQKRLASVMGEVGKASNFAGVPTDEDLSVQLQGKGLNPITTSNVPPQFLDTSNGPAFDQLNPLAAETAGAKRRALVAAIPPTKGESVYNPATGGMEREPDSRFNPLTQAKETFGVSTPITPTPTQLGTNKATEATTQAQGELDQGLPALKARSTAAQLQSELTAGVPGLKGQAFTQQENVERPAKVQTSAATAAATKQADINVETAPANVAKKSAAQAAIETAVEKAKTDLKEAGVPPQIADSFLHVTATGIPYAYIDPSISPEIRSVATKRAATTVPGIRFLTKAQADTMQQIDSGRAALRTYLDTYKSKLGSGMGGRITSAVKNTLGIATQNDSDLAAVSQAMYGPMIELFRASTAGVTGFRMTQAELANAQKAAPLPTDSYQTAIKKAATLGNILANLEKQVAAPGGRR